MKLEQLLYLSEAVKYNSISIAADKNYISQPTFSSAITKLEKELGVTLLKRNSKGVVATAAGEMVIEKAHQVLSTIVDIRESVSQYSNLGIINIAAIPCICDKILPTVIKRLTTGEQRFTVSVSTGESAQIINNVSAGIADLGILIYTDEPLGSEVSYTPLFTDEYVLYVGPNSPYWNRQSVSLPEALSQPYLAYRDEFCKRNSGLTKLLEQSPAPNIVFRTDDLESIKKLITQKDYVAFFPKFMSQDDVYLKHNLVKALPVSDMPLTFEVGYIESAKYKHTSIDRLFIETLKETVKSILSE